MTEKTTAPLSIPPWVIVLCLLPLLFGVHGHQPWTPDEPREAEIARGMAEDGPWLIPHLAGRPFVEKPPLYYWAAALMVRAAGGTVGATTAVRMVSALSAAATLLLLWIVGRSILGARRAGIALVILATSYGFVLAAHWINLDPLLMFLVSAAVLLFFQGVARGKTSILLGAYLAGGLAFLVKGFIAWAFIFPPCLYILWNNRRGGGRNLAAHLIGLLLFLGPPAAWMLAFYRIGGKELWREWLIVNHFGRFLGETHYLGHIQGPFFYLGGLSAVLAPWTPLLLDWIIRRGWRELREEDTGGTRLSITALIWALSGVILLSVSGTKRDIYLYPLLPAFALWLGAAAGKASRWAKMVCLVVSIILFLPLPVFSFLRLNWNGERLETAFGISGALLLCALAGGFSLFRFRGNYFARLAAVSALFYLGVVIAAFPVLDQVWSYEGVARELGGAIPPGKGNRVGGWYAGEVERGIFLYYCGIELQDVRDRGRLIEILSGKDPEIEYLVVSRMEEEFPSGDPGIPPWEVVAKAKKGPRRVFYLIRGKVAARRGGEEGKGDR